MFHQRTSSWIERNHLLYWIQISLVFTEIECCHRQSSMFHIKRGKIIRRLKSEDVCIDRFSSYSGVQDDRKNNKSNIDTRSNIM